MKQFSCYFMFKEILITYYNGYAGGWAKLLVLVCLKNKKLETRLINYKLVRCVVSWKCDSDEWFFLFFCNYIGKTNFSSFPNFQLINFL